MHITGTLIVGAGQAGLSLSHHLTRRGQPHVVLDRGRVGERWYSERWDSLRLLTPNWLNRLDGGAAHADADGFLSVTEFARYLSRYARARGVLVHERDAVTAVEPWRGGFRVATESGEWRARNVVVATGHAAEPLLPRAAASAPAHLRQLHSSRYRNPTQLPPGGVLVVGAGPSGQQIAAELRRAGRDVVLAVGRHTRTPRHYRGRDIWHWLDRLGDLERGIDETPDPVAARKAPNLAVTGANGGEQLDLAVLQHRGVALVGRVEGFDGRRALFARALAGDLEAADTRLRRLVARIDAHIEDTLPEWPYDAETIAAVRARPAARSIDLAARGIATVVWGTGYHRDYSWLHAPALDADGELVHRHGITDIPGLGVLGLKFQRRRASHFIGGVGADAAFLAEWISARLTSATPYCAATALSRP